MVQESPKLKLWVKDGLADLGRIIKSCRLAQNMSLDDVSELIFKKTGQTLTKKTIGNIENNVATRMPEFNTLALIQAAGFVMDKDGQVLSMQDFIDIACGLKFDRLPLPNKKPQTIMSFSDDPQAMSLSAMIQQCIAQNGLSQQVIEEQLVRLQELKIADLTLEQLRAIQHGVISSASDGELRTLQVLLDPDGSVFSTQQWEMFSISKRNPTIRQGNNHANGVV
jgi:transcriptional regulator with XRE-family HTH domain